MDQSGAEPYDLVKYFSQPSDQNVNLALRCSTDRFFMFHETSHPSLAVMRVNSSKNPDFLTKGNWLFLRLDQMLLSYYILKHIFFYKKGFRTTDGVLQWKLTFFEFVQLVDQNLFRVLQHSCNQINGALENIERGENGEVSEDDREILKPFLIRRTWIKNTLVTFQIFFYFLILQNKKKFLFLK